MHRPAERTRSRTARSEGVGLCHVDGYSPCQGGAQGGRGGSPTFFFLRQHNGTDLIQTCYMNYRVEVYYECVPDLEQPEIMATKNCSFIVTKP